MTLKLKYNFQFLLLPSFFLILIFAACSNDKEDVILPIPSISEVEIGLHHNQIGVLDEDFHFNAEVLAGDLLENVQINIVQKADETYSHDWSFEIVFTERIEGLKNASLHRHFDIPADAAKGIYDFIITANDQNGTSLEEIGEITLIDADDYPEVNPYVSVFGIDKIDVDGTSGFNSFYNNGEFKNSEETFFSKDESIWSAMQIGSVKGDGIMYGLLIKKSYNHKPETIEAIDFSKAIVTEYIEHSAEEEEVFILKNNRDTGHWLYGPILKIGAEEDNNLPDSYAITDGKAWENGTYYYGVVYTNITYNRSTFKYIEFEINGF
ncbi:DUF4625 domain-containing protein [Polaribacter sp. Asnod1-A03]|uniref:DUF4625 domain-containing protein n=1 Tax=Polaribacter sp. Asnod1-A03 TaxID=3160581 RepID=UPI00387020A6